MAGQGTKILVTDYNTIQSKIENVLGTGSGDYGYGQAVSSSQVSLSSKISVLQWSNLRSDILKARQHQTGNDLTTSLTNPAVGINITASDATTNRFTTLSTSALNTDLPVTFIGTTFGGVNTTSTYYISQVVDSTRFTISATKSGSVLSLTTGSGSMTMGISGIKITESDRAAYNSMADDCATYRLTTPPANQATRENLVDTQVKTAAWNGTLTQTVTVTFADATAARHYFNSGSQIEFSASRTGGTDGLKNTTWTTMFTQMGTIYINRSTTNCTGAGSPVTSIGWANLTTSDQLIFQKDSPSSTYAPNKYTIYARVPSAEQIVFTINFDDASGQPNAPWGTDENVDGTLTSTVQVYRASGSNVSLPKPSATTTSI